MVIHADYPLVRIGRRVLQVLAGLVVLVGVIELVFDPPRTMSFREFVVQLLGTGMQAFLLLLGAELLRLLFDLIETVRGLGDRQAAIDCSATELPGRTSVESPNSWIE